jgi:DNA-binding response OmpR family regulator
LAAAADVAIHHEMANLTFSASAEGKKKCVDAGTDDVLAKPFALDAARAASR